MNWWQLLIVWLGGWVTIILLNFVNGLIVGEDFITKSIQNELVSDADNLFKSGIFYFAANIICNFINLTVLHWILLVVGVVFCILPIISSFGMIANFKLSPKYIVSFIGALLSQTIPLIMALNIYFVHLN